MKSVIKSKLLSIEIGTYNTKIIIGKESNNKFLIKRAFTIKTPKDSILDGKIINYSKIKDFLGQALSDNKVKCKKGVFTLQSSKVITREIILPYVKEKEMTSMIEFEINENFPIDLDNHIIQYKLLETFEDSGGEKSRILVSALPKEIADGYYKLCKDLNLKPQALDIQPNVNNKIFKFMGENLNQGDFNNKTIAVLDIGYSNINLLILENSVFRFNRLLNNGGRDIDENISRVFDIDLQSAELKKHLIKDINNEFLGVDQLRLSNAVRGTVDIWVGDISRMFKYYTSRKLGNKIDEIYLHGGCVNLGGLPKYLEDALDIPIFKVNRLKDIILNKSKSEVELTTYLNAIGVLIGR